MTEKLISSNGTITKLTVISKKTGKAQAKLIPIKMPEKESKVLLPPQPQKYIKVKKHDFL